MARKALAPATLEIVQAVRSHATGPMVAAVSGGADSLALAYAVAHVCRERELPYAAVTVDHGLQDGSAARARTVADQLAAIGFADVVIGRVDVTPNGRPTAGPEGDARAARYAALDAEAATRDADLLLGHTLDDQAETVLLGLLRGSGARSLAGMAVRSGRRLRPLLGVRRDRTRTACEELGIEVWDDPHNADPRFTRSRIRQRLMPMLTDELGPGIPEALARTADLARADADLLDHLADDLYSSAVSAVSATGVLSSSKNHDHPDHGHPDHDHPDHDHPDHDHPDHDHPGNDHSPDHDHPDHGHPGNDHSPDHDHPMLDCALLEDAAPALRSRVIKRWLADCGAAEVPYNHVRAVEALIMDWHGQREVHVPGVVVRRIAGALTIIGRSR